MEMRVVGKCEVGMEAIEYLLEEGGFLRFLEFSSGDLQTVSPDRNSGLSRGF